MCEAAAHEEAVATQHRFREMVNSIEGIGGRGADVSMPVRQPAGPVRPRLLGTGRPTTDRLRLQARISNLVAMTSEDLWREEYRARHPVTDERWLMGWAASNGTPPATRCAWPGLTSTSLMQACRI
jgi:hypothetical protein